MAYSMWTGQKLTTIRGCLWQNWIDQLGRARQWAAIDDHDKEPLTILSLIRTKCSPTVHGVPISHTGANYSIVSWVITKHTHTQLHTGMLESLSTVAPSNRPWMYDIGLGYVRLSYAPLLARLSHEKQLVFRVLLFECWCWQVRWWELGGGYGSIPIYPRPVDTQTTLWGIL